MKSKLNMPAFKQAFSALLVTTALAGCITTGSPGPEEGVGFRQARFEEISAMRQYRDCRDEGLKLDEQARRSGSPARYLASARILEKCESGVGPETAKLAEEERMRAYALGIQNYLKGGDIVAARTNFEKFKSAFAGHDLYYPDGSSFVETMDIMLGLKDRNSVGEFSLVNVNNAVKSELRRVRYWKRN